MSKYNDLELQQIKEFFKQDVLNFRNFPIQEVADVYKRATVYHELDASVIKSDTKRKEFKDYLFLVFTEDIPYRYTSPNMKFVFDLPTYINNAPWNSVLESDDELDSKNCTDYFHSIDRHHDHVTDGLISRMKYALFEFYETRNGLDRDIWKVKDLGIADYRKNKSVTIVSLNFARIKNISNRKLIKDWYKYLIGETETALSTMCNYLTFMYQFCEEFNNKSFLQISREEFLEKMDDLKKAWSVNKYNKVLECVISFYEYLAVEEIMKEQSPILAIDKIRTKRQHYFNSVSEYVILQIFNHLYELPNDYLLMYLINYSTGMRASDVCQLKVDCLIKSEKCYFIKYNVQKMVKGHGVPISTALGELIEKRIKDIIELDYDEKYLFFRKENSPIQTDTFRKNMKKWCKKWGIKNEDGTDYNYVSHAYRHQIATDLVNNYGVSLSIVQLVVLGHANIQMSLSYIDTPEERQKMLNDTYIDKSGMNSPITSKDEISPSWTTSNISKQILPNGLCCYPTALGHCPNADICLNCTYFRTSKKFLPVHEQQLEKLKNDLIIYESNNFIHNIETTKQTIKSLERIIKSLKE